LASSPVPTPPRVSLRFLRAYLDGASRSRRRRIARAVLGKAARVGARRPKFG